MKTSLFVAEAISLLRDLQKCGSWYRSALEIDIYEGHDGEELKERLDELLKKVDES